MKISNKQYALALFGGIKNSNKTKIKQIINEFVELLVVNNDISKADKIINEFNNVWNKEQGIIEAEIKSARSLDSSVVKFLQKYIKEISKAKNVEVDKSEDKSLLGGVVVKYGDKVMDGSLRTRLKELKEDMVK